jgi:hypothetical protein
MSEGLNEKIAKLHATTLAQAHYHLKTSHGISEGFNAHMQPSPFLGSGQGAADSMPRWGFLSDKILTAYNKHSKQHPLLTPISKLNNTTSIQAFVDDSNCAMLNCHNNRNEIIEQLKFNADQWDSLHYNIGAKLEITKYKYVVINWKYDKNGTANLNIESEDNSILINESETNQPQRIHEIKPTEPYKLLGVDMCIDGSFAPQLQRLTEEITNMTNMLSKVPLTHQETTIGLKGIIYPTIKYGLEATTIPWSELDKIQAKLTNKLLPKLGFNQHMPRELVHAPVYFGGIGIQRIATEQGIQHLQHFIGSLRSTERDRTAILGLIEAYTITTGIINNTFEDTTKITYIESPWIQTTQQFL